MIRPSDFLLTLAALWLLVASLDTRSRHVTRASALTSQAGQSAHYPDQDQRVGVLMSKIKRNLEPATKAAPHDKGYHAKRVAGASHHEQQQPGPIVGDRHQHSYSYYANEMQQHNSTGATRHRNNYDSHQIGDSDQNEPQPERLFAQAQAVQIEFLRSNLVAHQSQQPPAGEPNATGQAQLLEPRLQGAGLQQARNDSSNKVYLLNHSQARPPATNRQSSEEVDANEVDVGEQQQPPPFAMLPPGALNQQLAGQSVAQNENIRQILNNYQRYPQAQQQLQQQLAPQRQLQHQPRPELVLRPPASQQLPQQQQPFSPLQLLTGPLQALLPGLGQQQQQQQQQQIQPTRRPAHSSTSGQQGHQNGAPLQEPNGASLPAQQQPRPFSLLNPFGSPGSGQPGQLPNLQDLYQQLPLYQALLAARQRQEALQAAQRTREQQHQHQQRPGANPARELAQHHNGGPALGSTLPASGFTALQPNQQQPVNNHNSWTPQQPAPTQPAAGPPSQQTARPHPASQAAPQQPANNANHNQVHFDDDNNNGGQPAQNDSQPDDAQRHNDNNNNQNSHDNDNEAPDGGEGAHEGQQANGPQQQDAANEQPNENGGGAGGQADGNRPADEEDPDLKQFQNLANGGDSFADLFPPGILSNNDISEIKKQQDEQAKRQEEEERQKQMRHQQHHQHQHQHQPARDQGGPGGQGAGEQQRQPDNNNNNSQQTDDNSEPAGGGTNEDAGAQGAQGSQDGAGGNEQPGQGHQDDADDQDDGAQQDSDDSEAGGSGARDHESPTAAALTSKSSSDVSQKAPAATDNGQRAGDRLAKSPGVEYASR